MFTRIRTVLKPYIFYPDPCGRGLKPLLSAVSVSGFTGFVWTEGRLRFQKYPDRLEVALDSFQP